MAKFRHHSSFAKDKHIRSYLLPNVCFDCRKTFKKPVSDVPRKCPQCAAEMVALCRKFSAPRSGEVQQWQKVRFLVEHGFFFQSVYDQHDHGGWCCAKYPRDMAEAREFVVKYQSQALARAF